MTNYVNKYVTKSATGAKRNKFNLSKQVITTNDFGIIKPLALRYCVPGDKHIIDVREFTRLMPMPSPTFGKIDTCVRAYFVPMRTVFPNFLEYISMNPSPWGSSQNTYQSVPYITGGNLKLIFLDSDFSVDSPDQSESSRCDFIQSSTKKNFTLHGKRIFDMLCSLNMNIRLDLNTSVLNANYKYSLLPLFAYLRTYIDWIVPARYLTSYRKLYGLIRKYSDPSTSSVVAKEDLKSVLWETRAFLEDDFFTSAWEMPFNNSGAQSALTLQVPNPSQSGDSDFVVNAVTNPINDLYSGAFANSATEEGEVARFSAYTLQTLGALQDMLNRGILAGTKVEDWLYTEFGIKPNNQVLDTSLYLGSHNGTITIGDVTSQADTADSGGAYLGQFAGKGIGSSNGKFSFECKEHGYIIFTSVILPRTSYYQGLAPEFSQFDRFDFFQPEFDNMAGAPLSYKLLCNSLPVGANGSGHTSGGSPNGIFGFMPRYAEMKTSFDTISGDFRVPTCNVGLNSWFLARDFEPNGNPSDFQHISLNFCDASEGTATNSYDRIFQSTDNMYDHFYQIFVLDWVAYRPMKSVSEFLMPQHEDDGKTITVSPNH